MPKGIVKAISEQNRSVLIAEGNTEIWHNLGDHIKMQFIRKGPCEYRLDEEVEEIAFIKCEKSETSEETQTSHQNQSSEKKKNWADEMTNFEDLLNAAHLKAKGEKKILSIRTQVIIDGNGNPMIDYEKKKAFFKAIVETDDEEFSGYGDAEGITNESIKPHFIRMAETRAIVRALRFYTNNAAVAEEETDIKVPIEKH